MLAAAFAAVMALAAAPGDDSVSLERFAGAVANIVDYIKGGDEVGEAYFGRIVRHLPETESGAELEAVEGYGELRGYLSRGNTLFGLDRNLRLAVLLKLGDGKGATALLDGGEFASFGDVAAIASRVDGTGGGAGVAIGSAMLVVGRDRRNMIADALRASAKFAGTLGFAGGKKSEAAENYAVLEEYFAKWFGWEELRDFLVRGKDIGIAIENPISEETLRAYLAKLPLDPESLAELASVAPKFESPAPVYEWMSAFGTTVYGAGGTLFSPDAFTRGAHLETIDAYARSLSSLLESSGSGRGGGRPKRRHDGAALSAKMAEGLSAHLDSGKADLSVGAILDFFRALDGGRGGAAAFVSRNARRLVAVKLFPDSGSGGLQEDFPRMLADPQSVKLFLSQLSRGMYPAGQRSAYLRFYDAVAGSWNGQSPSRSEPGFIVPGEPEYTVGEQFLRFYLRYYREIDPGRFVQYDDALWRAFDFGPGGRGKPDFVAFLAEGRKRLERPSFTTEKSLSFLAEQVLVGPWKAGDAAALVFSVLVPDAYVDPAVPASEKNRLLTQTLPILEGFHFGRKAAPDGSDAWAGFKEFYPGFVGSLSGLIASPGFGEGRDFRSCVAYGELAAACANVDPTAIPSVAGWALGRYRLFDPFVAESRVEEETVEKEFFGERRHAPPASLNYRLLSDGKTEAPTDRNDKAEESLAVLVKGALRRIPKLRSVQDADRCMDGTLAVMRSVPGGTGGIDYLVGGEKPKMLARRAFEFAVILIDGERDYDPDELANANGEDALAKIARILGIAESIDGKPLALRLSEIRDEVRKLAPADAEARAARKADFVGLVEGLQDFMYRKATEALAADIRETALLLDDAQAYEAVVKAFVKIVYYHPDQKVSAAVAREFVKLFGGAGNLPGSLYGDYARICFFSFRNDAALLGAAFGNLYRRYRDSPERGGQYVSAMLVFADDEKMRAVMRQALDGDPEFKEAIGLSPEESLFVYRVFGTADYAKLVAKPEFRDAFARDFTAFAPAVKKVFEACQARLTKEPGDAVVRAIDERLRVLVAERWDEYAGSMKGLVHFSRIGEADPKEAARARETGAAIFGFFVNEARVLSGEFLDSNIFYFPRPMRKFIDAPSAWEKGVASIRPVSGERSWFDFFADGAEFYFGLERRFGVKDFASGLVYVNAAIYDATRAILQAEKEGRKADADRLWEEKVVSRVFDPILRGRIFDGRDYSYEKYEDLRNIRFATGSKYDGTHFLLESLYVSWIREELGALQPSIERRFTAMMATFFVSATLGISVDNSQEFLDHTLLPLFRRTVENNKFDYGPVADGIYPKQGDFFADPCRPLYVDPRFNYGKYNYLWNLRAGQDLKDGLSAWYRFAPDNARFFELMPAFLLRDEQLTAGSRPNGNPDPVRASWGFYLHRLDVAISEEGKRSVRVAGFLRFPGNVNDVLMLSDPPAAVPPEPRPSGGEGAPAAAGPAGAETREPEPSDSPRWAVARTNATSSIRYEFTYLTNDRAGTTVNAAGLGPSADPKEKDVGIGAYLGGVVFIPQDMVFRNLKRNADLIVAARGAGVDPATLTIFSDGRWLRVDADRFRMDGFNTMDDVYSLNGTVGNTDAISAFSGAKRAPLARNPIVPLDRKRSFDTVWFAAIEKQGQLGLVEKAAAGSKFHFVFRSLDGSGDAEIWPIEVVAEGYNSLKFKFVRFGSKKAPPPVEDAALSFAVTCSSPDSAESGAFCIGVDAAAGKVRTWEKLLGVSTELSFDAPLPVGTRSVIVRDKAFARAEYDGWLMPGSVDADSGRIVGGAVAVQPALFAELDKAGVRGRPESRNVYVRFQVQGPGGPRSAFVTAAAGRFSITPNYGDAYFLGIFNRFIMNESAERYRKEIGDAASRWFRFDGFGAPR